MTTTTKTQKKTQKPKKLQKTKKQLQNTSYSARCFSFFPVKATSCVQGGEGLRRPERKKAALEPHDPSPPSPSTCLPSCFSPPLSFLLYLLVLLSLDSALLRPASFPVAPKAAQSPGFFATVTHFSASLPTGRPGRTWGNTPTLRKRPEDVFWEHWKAPNIFLFLLQRDTCSHSLVQWACPLWPAFQLPFSLAAQAFHLSERFREHSGGSVG